MNLVDLQLSMIKELTDIGRALSSEKNHTRLLEKILKKAQSLTNADGGTLYICTEDKTLHFEIMVTKSLKLHFGGTSKLSSTIKPLLLYNSKGEPNKKLVATSVAHTKKTINVKDVYKETKYDFSGTIQFDKLIGYHSQSFLTVPMTDHLNQVIGVLQLINKIDKKNHKIIAFSTLDKRVIESLAAQAAVTLTNQNLIENQKELFNSLIKLIATSIDEKSPYTAGHCKRVPVLTRLLANAVCRINKGPLKAFKFTDDEKYELDVAAWLHDCGKITTPVQVVDKATKLEKIIDRIDWIDTRFEILRREAIIEHILKKNKVVFTTDSKLQKTLSRLAEQQQFLHHCNIGKESIADSECKRIEKIAKQHWKNASGIRENLLTQDEIMNLKINRGTLSGKDREIINRHVSVGLNMLETLPYPKNLQKVPLIAGAHHEKMDGSGYPGHLTNEDLPIQARILAIADVFEALTASDRPYKKAMPLSQALSILGQMKLEGHIDPDLFDVFIHEKIYESYAKKYLDKKLIDKLDITKIPGYHRL